jgi:hypothetical protein
VADWQPWRELRDRPHIGLRFTDLPAGLQGVYARRGDRAAILLERTLGRVERRCVLAHELAHDDLGAEPAGAQEMPGSWDAVRTRADQRIELLAVSRLVPLDELRRFADALVELGYGVEAIDVAEKWDVTVEVAARALQQLPVDQ